MISCYKKTTAVLLRESSKNHTKIPANKIQKFQLSIHNISLKKCSYYCVCDILKQDFTLVLTLTEMKSFKDKRFSDKIIIREKNESVSCKSWRERPKKARHVKKSNEKIPKKAGLQRVTRQLIINANTKISSACMVCKCSMIICHVVVCIMRKSENEMSV